MLVFLDLIYPYILATTVISFLGFWISMVLFFGISGLELRNQSSENLNTFFRKRHVKYISFVGIASLLILMLIRDRKSTRLNSSHVRISYAVFCLKKKKF